MSIGGIIFYAFVGAIIGGAMASAILLLLKLCCLWIKGKPLQKAPNLYIAYPKPDGSLDFVLWCSDCLKEIDDARARRGLAPLDPRALNRIVGLALGLRGAERAPGPDKTKG